MSFVNDPDFQPFGPPYAEFGGMCETGTYKGEQVLVFQHQFSTGEDTLDCYAVTVSRLAQRYSPNALGRIGATAHAGNADKALRDSLLMFDDNLHQARVLYRHLQKNEVDPEDLTVASAQREDGTWEVTWTVHCADVEEPHREAVFVHAFAQAATKGAACEAARVGMFELFDELLSRQ